jgi:hypothetical protein
MLQNKICEKYWSQTISGYFLSNLVTVLITVINIVIRTMNIALIDYVGMDKLSMQVRSIMTSIFGISFINTAIILLLVNANLDYSVLSFVPLKN